MATTTKPAARAATKEGDGKIAKPDSEVFANSVDMKREARTESIRELNKLLADVFDLMSQTKQAHWNIKGPRFIGLHKLFDEFAEGLEDYIDMIAERITALGGYALGTARMAANSSRIPEYPTDVIMDLDHVRALSERYAVFANTTRTAINATDEAGDRDTSDLLTDVSRDVDKWLWFLEAHLQAPPGEPGLAHTANRPNGQSNQSGH